MQQIEVLKSRLKHFRLTRWGVTFVFALGIGLSVLLQVLHAPASGGWVAMVVGGVPPVAVFLCVEMISRIPIEGKLGAITRISIASAVAALAIVVSYEQQYDYVESLGFVGYSVIPFPLIIDGVMFVATLSLVEVTRIVRNLREEIVVLSAPSIPPVSQPVKEESRVNPSGKPTFTPTGKRGRKPGPQHPSDRRRMPKNSTITDGLKKRPEYKPSAPSPDKEKRPPIEAIVVEDLPSLPSATERSVPNSVTESPVDS